MQILIDAIDKAPHVPGDLVLHVRDEKWEMEVRWAGHKHRIYFYRLDLGRIAWKPHTIDVVEVSEVAKAVAWTAWRKITVD